MVIPSKEKDIMAWHGSVTCSHCYNRGHNRRKCAKLTSHIKGEYDQYVEHIKTRAGMGDTAGVEHYERLAEKKRQEYLKRTKVDLGTGKKVTNKAAKSERMKNVTCGYCGNSGHTRRVCQNAKNDYLVYVERTKVHRADWLERLQATGMGKGSLVIGKTNGRKPDGEWGQINITALVISINFGDVDAHCLNPRALRVKSNDQMRGMDGYHANTIHNLSLSDCEDPNERRYTILPSGGTTIVPPDGWVENVDCRTIKEVFPTNESRAYDYRYQGNEQIAEIRDLLGMPSDAYHPPNTPS
jgi:hypothetical protein